MSYNPLTIAVYLALFCFCVAMVVTLLRFIQGPAMVDRVLALDTLYLNALGALLLLGMASDSGSGHRDLLFEIALLVAVLGFVGTVAAARFLVRDDVME